MDAHAEATMRDGTTLTATLLVALAACAGPPPTPADPSSVEIVGDELEARATPDGLHLLVHLRSRTVPCAAGGCRLGLVYSWSILHAAFSHRFPTE